MAAVPRTAFNVSVNVLIRGICGIRLHHDEVSHQLAKPIFSLSRVTFSL